LRLLTALSDTEIVATGAASAVTPEASLGVHLCAPQCTRNTQTGTVTYTGVGVDICNQLCRMAHGGQILFGTDVYTMAMQAIGSIEKFCVESLGYKKEGVIPEYFVVYQMVPQSQQERMEFFKVTPVPPVKNPSWALSYSDLTVETIIGSGSFGSVYSAKYKGQSVILKQFAKQKYSELSNLQMRAESAQLSKLTHENVVLFYGLITVIPNMGFVAEYCSRGGLNQVLYEKSKDLSWSRRLDFAIDAAKGMAYLHQSKIVHGDLKSSNLMVTETWRVKVADAGFSKVKLDNQTMTQVGAVSWTAPEVTQDALYSDKSDVYSFGIILWEILFRTKPWEGMHTMKIIVTVESGERPSLSPLPPQIPQAVVPIIQSCWHGNPTQRPSFELVQSQLQALKLK